MSGTQGEQNWNASGDPACSAAFATGISDAESDALLGVVEELAQPLLALRLLLDLLSRPALPQGQKQASGVHPAALLAEAMVQTHRAQEVLLLLRDALQPAVPGKQPIDLIQIFRAVLMAAGAGARVTCDLPPAVWVQAPPQELRVLLACLLTTALASPDAAATFALEPQEDAALRVCLRISFPGDAPAHPGFAPFFCPPGLASGLWSLARMLACRCDGELGVAVGVAITSIFLRLPTAQTMHEAVH